MEFPSLDAFDVFMVGNATGFTFGRNYISGSNYLQKMSDFEFSDWEINVLDALYYNRLSDEILPV
jgi:hypothetical protein